MSDVQSNLGRTEQRVYTGARSLAEEPCNSGDDPEGHAHVLLEESEQRTEDPGSARPTQPAVVRRTSDEGVPRDHNG
jgi:hypothetical protein